MEYCGETGKPCYSKKEAQTAKNLRLSGRQAYGYNTRKKGKKSSGRPDYLRIYPCPHCNAWHLTSRVNYEQHG